MAAPLAAAATAGTGNAAVGNAAVQSYFSGSAIRNDDSLPKMAPRAEMEAKHAAPQKDDKTPAAEAKGPKEDVGAAIGDTWHRAGSNLRFKI